jgi:hypothetical protein
MKKGNENAPKGKSTYQKQLKSNRDRPANVKNNGSSNQARERTQQRIEGDDIDLKFGYERLTEVIIVGSYNCFKQFVYRALAVSDGF